MSFKKITFIFLLCNIVLGLSAQSIYKNEYYLKSLEFKALADKNYEEGMYDEAYTNALEAEKFALLSDEYIARMQLKFTANSRYKAAENRIAYADSINLIGFDVALYQDARDTLDSAKGLYDLESYQDSIDQSNRILTLLESIQPQKIKISIPISIVQALPKFYTVRLIPEKRDCFWRIAEYEFVYADGTKWTVLYDENRDQIQDPSNPHLIQPGQVFEIPSIKGESRDGMYDPEIDYPSINAE